MLDIFKYFNLIKTISLTDFKLKYQGSVLGYLWSLVKPLMLFLVMYFVFTKVFKIGGDIPYYPVYLLLGIVVWTFFLETTISCLLSIVSKGDLIRKVYFPRAVLIISNSMTAFLTFLANLAIVVVFMVFNHVPFTWNILFVPFVMIELYVFVLGVGLILSSLYVKFRDISHIWEVTMQALFYATPILYSPLALPVTYRKILMLSPIAQILQDFRYLTITTKTITVASTFESPFLIAIPYIIPFVVFAVGYILFEKMAAKFAEDV